MVIITAVVLMNCGDNIVNGSAEYHELEVDMEEFCFGQMSDIYYIGPKYYDFAELFLVIKEENLMVQQNIIFSQGVGFRFSCPDTNNYLIKWN